MNPMLRLRRHAILYTVLLIWLTSGLWQAYKPLPDGVSMAMPWRAADSVSFLADRTFVDAQNVRHSEQEIFDQAFAMIRQAQRLIVLDMFLFNDFTGAADDILRPLSGELTKVLLERMAQVGALQVVVITDPVNTVYGALESPYLQRLRGAGAEVVVTDLSALRASNPTWSGPWAVCCAWLGNSAGHGWLPDPLAGGKITLRSWLALPNFRANHRKILVVDHGDDWQALVTSGNPHDGSSAHDNVAMQFSGEAALDLVASEAAVARFSGEPLDFLPPAPATTRIAQDGIPRLRVLTEGAIRHVLLEVINAAENREALDVAVFYLSDGGVIRALKAAQQRGVEVRMLLDPNEDAFGRKKNGVPNRPVAAGLMEAGIPVRWCDTHGEQCHAKFLLHRTSARATLIVGSANFTRRNLADLNLETSVQLVAAIDHSAIHDAENWFELVWGNEPGQGYSIDYERYADDAIAHRWWYRIGEATGFSTW